VTRRPTIPFFQTRRDDVLWLTMVLSLVIVAGMVAYAVARLLQLRKDPAGDSQRLEALAQAHGPDRVGRAVEAPGPLAPTVVDTAGVSVGLRTLSTEAVFFKRGRDGEVVVQVGHQRSMPLRLVLDLGTRSVMERTVGVIDRQYGTSWSALAEEDDGGRLRLTRLG
jgi:hypothetical protein